MPNGLAPSFFSCYLSRPVVWGELFSWGPPPPEAAGWGGGLIQLVSPVECGEPSELGQGPVQPGEGCL